MGVTTLADLLRAVPPAELSVDELIGGVLAPGLEGEPARRRGADVLAAVGGALRLSRMSVRELEAVLGAEERAARQAVRLVAALALGRRLARVAPPSGPIVRGVVDLEPHLRGVLDGLLKEVFLAVLLDARHRPLRTERISEGCLTWSVVHPREVFAPAVRESAGAVIVAHNHPSGDPTPSRQDLEVTRRLMEAGETLGIPLLDHIVVGSQRCVSMRAEGWLS